MAGKVREVVSRKYLLAHSCPQGCIFCKNLIGDK